MDWIPGYIWGIRLHLFEPPWRRSDDDVPFIHWYAWLVGWLWVLDGLLLGAVVAPSLVQRAHLPAHFVDGWLALGIAVVVGFLSQLLGWLVVALLLVVAQKARHWPDARNAPSVSFWPWLLAAAIAPFAGGLGYGIYRVLSWVGGGQWDVFIAFAGGLLVTMFVIPLIKGIVTGALFRWFMKWLRGGKDTKKAD